MRRGGQAVRGLWVLLALVSLLLAAPAPARAADPTELSVAAEFYGDGNRMSVSGELRSGETGVGGAEVRISIGATQIGSATTDRRGGFRYNLSVPEEFATGTHTVTVRFPGNEQYAAAEGMASIGTAGQETSPPGDPQPEEPVSTAPPPDTRPTASVSLTALPDNPYPGDLLTLEGRVTAADRPVASAAVHVTIGGIDSPDSLTYTNTQGYFSTFLEVPTEQAEGETAVRVSTPETGAHKAGSNSRGVIVRQPEVVSEEPTPTPQDPTPEVTAEETVDVEQSVTATATVEAEEEDEGTTAVTPSPWSWFLVTLVVVGGSALLVSIALLMRRSMLKGEREADASEAVFLLDSEDAWEDVWDEDDDAVPAPDDPEATQPDLHRPLPHHGHPGSGPSEPQEPVEPPKPRRSLPPED